MSGKAKMARILVWDAPTRAFHWLMVLSFGIAYLTGDSERWRDVHVLAGYTMAGLLAFRVFWGFAGTRYARFSAFLFAPRDLARYVGSLVRGRPEHHVGHNPAGSLAIFAVLALGAAVTATGYGAYATDIEWMGGLHEGTVAVLLAVVGVHVAGVLVSSLLHRENLVRAMVTGRKVGDAQEGIRRGHAWLAAVLVAAVVAFWYQGAGDAMPGAQMAQARAAGHHARDH